jgi:hypothetical protein
MLKRSVIYIAVAILAQAGGAVASAPQTVPIDALRMLLNNDSILIANNKDCEAFKNDQLPNSKPVTLADDIALSLGSMKDGPIRIEHACEPQDKYTKLCTVLFTLSNSTQTWSRVYQFETPARTSNYIQKVKCFQIP